LNYTRRVQGYVLCDRFLFFAVIHEDRKNRVILKQLSEKADLVQSATNAAAVVFGVHLSAQARLIGIDRKSSFIPVLRVFIERWQSLQHVEADSNYKI
jgi:hypothetical protein